MAEYKKAIPTEYMGVVFDSKSEAIFARSLEYMEKNNHVGADYIHWKYHPEEFKIGDYVPDFLIIQHCPHWKVHGNGEKEYGIRGVNNRIRTSLLEYKPSRPTDAYIEKIIKYCKEIEHKDVFRMLNHMSITYGNPFNDGEVGGVVIHFHETIKEHEENKWTMKYKISVADYQHPYAQFMLRESLNWAKNYRFDLVSNSQKNYSTNKASNYKIIETVRQYYDLNCHLLTEEHKKELIRLAKIKEIVGDFFKLGRMGVNYKCPCPFHDDNDVRLTISPSRNLFKCFHCGEGGSPLQFLLKFGDLTHDDAFKYLAVKYKEAVDVSLPLQRPVNHGSNLF